MAMNELLQSSMQLDEIKQSKFPLDRNALGGVLRDPKFHYEPDSWRYLHDFLSRTNRAVPVRNATPGQPETPQCYSHFAPCGDNEKYCRIEFLLRSTNNPIV